MAVKRKAQRRRVYFFLRQRVRAAIRDYSGEKAQTQRSRDVYYRTVSLFYLLIYAKDSGFFDFDADAMLFRPALYTICLQPPRRE